MLLVFGAAAILLGLVIFGIKLVGARRGTNSANLEYGVAPAMLLAIGAGVIDGVTGWPDLPWAYPIVFIVLAAILCWVILRAARR